MTPTNIARGALLGAALALAATTAQAAEVTVMISGAFMGAYKALLPGFEKATGDHVITVTGSSTGPAPDVIPNRLARGEPADLLIVSRSVLDDLVAKGMVVSGTQTDLSRSGLALAVKTGAPKPDISSVETFKATLLAARSVAYPDTIVGAFVSDEVYRRLGIAEPMAVKSRAIAGGDAGATVARGEEQYAIQQSSELKVTPGVEVVGLLPDSLQRVTVFSAGVASGAKQPEEARKLIAYLASPAANATIVARGGAPLNGGKPK